MLFVFLYVRFSLCLSVTLKKYINILTALQLHWKRLLNVKIWNVINRACMHNIRPEGQMWPVYPFNLAFQNLLFFNIMFLMLVKENSWFLELIVALKKFENYFCFPPLLKLSLCTTYLNNSNLFVSIFLMSVRYNLQNVCYNII